MLKRNLSRKDWNLVFNSKQHNTLDVKGTIKENWICGLLDGWEREREKKLVVTVRMRHGFGWSRTQSTNTKNVKKKKNEMKTNE